MDLPNYDDFPCPVCGSLIGEHTDSPFGNNPKIDVPTGEISRECGRSHHSLVIEKLTAWWKDALGERDAYMKSYKGACKEHDILQKRLGVAIRWIRYLSYGNEYNDFLAEIEKIK